jgi:uncharacterized protein with ATP-grasp and redox domains
MSLGIARVAMKDEGQVRSFMEKVLGLKYFDGENWKVTSPEVIQDVWLKVIEVTGRADPLKEVKEEQNEKALTIYPRAKEFVLKSEDPFLEAIRLAIAANSIDAMTDVRVEVPEEIIQQWFRLEIDRKNFNELKERVRKARSVVYLGDNCGEIVFDRLLIEVLLELHHLKITYVTRRLPIMNDATLPDVLSVGMGKIVQIMENGIREFLPGTFLKKINLELKTLIDKSDLVISKGGGNYDSLTEEEKIKGKTSFLFLAKCYPYCHLHHVSLNTPIIYNF